MKQSPLRKPLAVLSLIVVLGLTAGCAAPAAAIPAGIAGGVTTGVAVKTAIDVAIVVIPITVPVIAAVVGSPSEPAATTSAVETVNVAMTVLTDIPAGATASWENEAGKTPTPRKFRVAFINDDRITWESTTALLLYKMTATISWYESCEPLLANFIQYDLYIVDGQMPGLSGPPCAQEIRTLHPGSVILGLTASYEMVRWFNELGFPAVFAADGPKALFEAVKLLGFF